MAKSKRMKWNPSLDLFNSIFFEENGENLMRECSKYQDLTLYDSKKMSKFHDIITRINDPEIVLLLQTQYSCLNNGSLDYAEFMDALSELLDTGSFNQLFLGGMDANSSRDVHYILDSLSRHPRAKKLAQSLKSVKFTSLESIHSEILRILLGNEKLMDLFRRLWAAFFPWYYDLNMTATGTATIGTATAIGNETYATTSSTRTADTKPNAKTLYDLSQIHYLDKKSIQLLNVLDKTGQNLKAKDQMQYILKSLKNHSDSNIMFYYRIKDSMNLLDVVDKFFNDKYSDSENLKVDILHVFSNFLEEFPMDQYGLKRGLAHFEYLWNYFFPNLSSRTRRKRTL